MPYADVAAQRSPAVQMYRHDIRDLAVPTPDTMNGVLDAIDASLADDNSIYGHYDVLDVLRERRNRIRSGDTECRLRPPSSGISCVNG